MDVLGVDLVVVDDGPQPGTGEGDLGVRVLALEEPGMEAGGKGVPAEVVQPQQGGEGHPPHPPHQGPLLGLHPVGEHPLVARQMKLLVPCVVVGLLEHRHIVHPAPVEVGVLVGVHGVHLDAHHFEILPGDFAGLPDVLHVAHLPALSGEDEDFLQAGFGDGGHLPLNPRRVQLGPADLVVAVEAAVDAVVLAVVGDVDGGKQVHVVPKIPPLLQPGLLSHLLQEGLRRRREEGGKVLRGALGGVQSRPHVLSGVGGLVIPRPGCRYL